VGQSGTPDEVFASIVEQLGGEVARFVGKK
jgi:hypothetical protein